ncbi:hypothetical protein BHE90_015481 [Fusarium euwallaceae]|uniref:Ecp2 effector protein domain-containing protein n=2 Tax=Fusarium solani species complex TaxID=232080 RepID=A0A3M2RZ55_9HYPO|nr:hypothetical protein CDV36_009804 [Fusarium kuroshium]RTE70122.1 hypothetical protein BHE90_015481 [Fusarium euwallaceae]
MKLLFLTPILALATSVTATEYICETTDGSPYLHHVNQLIDGLWEKKFEATCLDYGLGSKDCGPTIRGYSGKDAGAAWQICKGDHDEDYQPLRCELDPGGMPCAACRPSITMGMVAGHFENLRDQCQGPDSKGDVRVGGIVKLPYVDESTGGGEIRLYSMPG